MKPGFHMQVNPGFNGMTGRQRHTVLLLGERGELRRTVWVRGLAGGAWHVTDRHSAFVIQLDGEYDRIAVPTTEAPR